MTVEQPTTPRPPLKSDWLGLSPHLIASFWPVERSASSRTWLRIPDSPSVQAPLTESNIEVALNWQSPFEGAGQSAMPTLQAMLQSGALQPAVKSSGAASNFLSGFEGRTGITKLNSTQVFGGMPPLKITVTALFRAWSDPATEVEAPVNQLMKWALPQELAPDGAILSILEAVKGLAKGASLSETAAQALLPSVAPTKIAMHYKGRTYSPLVIESIGLPIGSNVDKNGRYVEHLVPMTLCSLTAIDRKDWEQSNGFGGFSS